MAADFITDFISSMGMDFSNPITLAINIILSTIVGGLVLLLIVEVIGKKYSEEIHPMNAFLMVLIINLINVLGVSAFLLPFISFIPFIGLTLPLIIWIVLVWFFFRSMAITHVILVGIVGYVLSLLVIPYLVGIVSGFIPAL